MKKDKLFDKVSSKRYRADTINTWRYPVPCNKCRERYQLCAVCMAQCGNSLYSSTEYRRILSNRDGWAEPNRNRRAQNNLRNTSSGIPYYLSAPYLRRKDGMVLCPGVGMID